MLYAYAKNEQGDLRPAQVRASATLVREEFKNLRPGDQVLEGDGWCGRRFVVTLSGHSRRRRCSGWRVPSALMTFSTADFDRGPAQQVAAADGAREYAHLRAAGEPRTPCVQCGAVRRPSP